MFPAVRVHQETPNTLHSTTKFMAAHVKLKEVRLRYKQRRETNNPRRERGSLVVIYVG